MIGTKFATIRGKSHNIDRSSMATEGITRNNEGRMPIQNALLFNARWQRWVTEIYPIHHAELHRRLIRQCIRCEFWWMRHCLLHIFYYEYDDTAIANEQMLLTTNKQKLRCQLQAGHENRQK